MESGFSEFFQQLPPILPIALCGSGLLLVVLLVVIVSARTRRGRAGYVAAAPMTPRMATTGELPDLDLLLGGHEPPVPPLPPAPAAPDQTDAPVPPPPAPAPAQAAAPETPLTMPRRRNSTYTLELPNGRSVEATEVLVISRDMADGGLIIQIGDRAYRNASEIDNEAARRRFNTTIRELARQAMSADRQTGEVAKAAAEPRRATSEQPRAASVPPPLPASMGGAMPGDLPKFKTDETPLLAPRKRNQPPPPPVPELNIADAIETYLQYKLAHTPAYTGRSIHVHASPGGGVAIEVDGQFYETVGEVDNDEVRGFLSSTIEEWQSRQ